MWNHQSNKTERFEQLFKQHYSRLCMRAYQYVGDAEEAKDLVNDIFEMVWKQADALDPETAGAYLMAAVRNRCLNLLDHRRVVDLYASQQEAEPTVEAETSGEEDEQLYRAVEQACRQLPDKTRYILSQCYFHRKKYKEVAEELAITTDGVKKHIMKALKYLRETVGKERIV